MSTFVLFLHVLSASVWVGGQVVLAGVVPTVRRFGDDAPRQVAQAFNRIAWPAFGLAVVTGIGNVLLVGPEDLGHPTVEIKLLLVVASGIGALVHQTARGNRARLAAGGAVALLGGIGAMYAGLLL